MADAACAPPAARAPAAGLCALPCDVFALALRGIAAADVAALREACRGALPPGAVSPLCEALGGAQYAALMRLVLQRLDAKRGGSAGKARKPPTAFPGDVAIAPMTPLKGCREGPATPTAAAGAPPPALALCLLRVTELQRVADGLLDARDVSAAEEARGARGYWVSKNWAIHARRYHEQAKQRLLKRVCGDAPSSGSGRKGRSRTLSTESLPPWPDANVDLLCEHGALAPRNSAPRAKRVLVDRATWRAIQQRFPLSTKLKASARADCAQCLGVAADHALVLKKLRERQECDRQARVAELDVDDRDGKGLDDVYAPPKSFEGAACADTPGAVAVAVDYSALLRQLLGSRERAKRGVPLDRVSPDGSGAPLLPGRYHLVPHDWLRAWRRSLRISCACKPGPPNTSDYLCSLHGKPLVPSGVDLFLRGQAPTPVIDASGAACCEVVTADEWRAVNALYPVDFAVAFDVKPSRGGAASVSYPTEPCRLCDASGRANSVDIKFRPRDLKRGGRARASGDDAIFW
ncbi:hypothetical protein M885DRAFT_616471 [Pelagophyceae sp. CCMP2097]|nr:hypothetical protein M885DRAFT_616471 [Pelagophyceae sp. CCMP2097]